MELDQYKSKSTIRALQLNEEYWGNKTISYLPIHASIVSGVNPLFHGNHQLLQPIFLIDLELKIKY